MAGLGLRTTGRAAKPLEAELDSVLGQEELDSLQGERGTKPPVIKEMRERHHHLARLIAEGRKPGEAATIARYTLSRVSILMTDPAFKDLIEHYRNMVEDQYIGFNAQLAALGVDAANIISERLEDNPDDVSMGALLQLVTISADRTGHGPSQKTEVNVKIGLADRLMQARSRAQVARDVTPPEANE